MTEVLLIPCCGRKRRGGSRVRAHAALQDLLSKGQWEHLVACRIELARIVGLRVGSDLTGSGALSTVVLMPAFERYDGNLYRAAQLRERDVSGPRRVLIVSALYGVLDARDPIRKYDLEMSCTLPGKITIKRWWREHSLLAVVTQAIERCGATAAYDFLSGHYQDALRDLDQHIPARCAFLRSEYPGLGSGSDHHRGNDIRQILLSSAT